VPQRLLILRMAASPPASPPSLFYSYAHEDEELRDELAKHLKILVRLKLLAEWHDREIVAGSEWADEITEELEKASIILLLISADFLASDYCWSKEMTHAIERHDGKTAIVIPIILRSCDWSLAPFATLQALPTNAKPVVSWDDRDEAWTVVGRGIRRALEKVRAAAGAASIPGPASTETPAVPETGTSAASQSTASLQALWQLMRDKPAVRSAVEKFSAGFSTASQQLDFLVNLKDVHDLLHTLHFQCYNFVIQESRKEAAAITWEGLIDPEATLGHILHELGTVTARPTLSGLDVAWLDELAEAQTELTKGNASQDGRRLKQAANLLNRVLSVQPTQINIRLREAARNLPIADLETTMRNVAAQLTPEQLSSADGVRFKEGVEALGRLNQSLSELTKEHDQLQALDAELRRVERELSQNTEELELSWPGLKKRLDRLCAAGTPWAVDLSAEAARLDAAVRDQLPVEMRQAFRRCYAQAGIRFYQVDLQLKKFCDELREVGRVLNDIWRSV
jgi:hypothetical protein